MTIEKKSVTMNNDHSLNVINAQKHRNLASLEKNKIQLSSLDEFEKFISTPGVLDRESLIIRCTIDDGTVTIKTIVPRRRSEWRLRNRFEPFIKKVAGRINQRTEFFMLVSDTIYVSDIFEAEYVSLIQNVPFLRCDWLTGDRVSENSIIIPDFRLIDAGYPREFKAVCEKSIQIRFEDREHIIKWRGTLSGSGYPDIYNCKQFPRYHLLMQSITHPTIVDARLTTYENFVESDAAIALQKRLDSLLGGVVPRLRPEEFAAYRYLLAADGVTAPWKTVPLRLATGSVLLMQHNWLQFFSPGLIAWEHYVPLADDMLDLAERFAWLEDNPEQSRKIALAGQRFAHEILHPNAIENYFVNVVNRCGELLNN
jgi:Glycosyl transferase family 90